MTVHAAFAKELARLQNTDNSFLALLRYDDNLHSALLDVEDRIRLVTLGENDVALPNSRMVFPSPTLARKSLGSNGVLVLPAMPILVLMSTLASGRRRCQQTSRALGPVALFIGDFAPGEASIGTRPISAIGD
jgi:hypothetical protein